MQSIIMEHILSMEQHGFKTNLTTENAT